MSLKETFKNNYRANFENTLTLLPRGLVHYARRLLPYMSVMFTRYWMNPSSHPI